MTTYRSLTAGKACRRLAMLMLLQLIGFSAGLQASAANTNQLSNSSAVMENDNKEPSSDTLGSNRLVSANTRLGFKLFTEVAKQTNGNNVLISPASVGLALAMTYNGADGETEKVMADLLETKKISLDELNRTYAKLKSTLEGADPKVQLRIASSLWVKRGVTFKPEFVQRNKQFYDAQVNALNFDDPSAPAIINSWIVNETKGKISKIVDKIDPQSFLFIMNAIYFKGKWAAKFDEANTKEEIFTTADGRQKIHPMMHQAGNYRYYEGKGFQAVSLPYSAGQFSMYIFLPAKGISLVEFAKNLTEMNWASWMKEFVEAKGDIVLPRFKVEYEIGLNDTLKALGIGIAFDPDRANFSGMVQTSRNTFISLVKHKIFMEVNEEGTEAAAVTSVETSVTSAIQPQKSFRMIIDRAFFCAVRDNKTGTILFMGSITDPG